MRLLLLMLQSFSHLFCSRETLHELCTTKEIFKDIKGIFLYFDFQDILTNNHLCYRGIHQKTMSQCSYWRACHLPHSSMKILILIHMKIFTLSEEVQNLGIMSTRGEIIN